VTIVSRGPVRLAFTDRLGGASRAPYDSLNLAEHVGDDLDTVRGNRLMAAKILGVPRDRIVYMNQVHGAQVALARTPWPDEEAPKADALVTDQEGLALAVLVADCVPVLLADPVAGVVGAAHAGRPGMAAGVVPATVEAMRDLGAQPARMQVHTGPGVCGACYEVPEDMRADVAAREPASWATTRKGTPAVDVRAGVAAQLRRAGIPESGIYMSTDCTMESERYFSYRRDGVTGRFAGFVWLGSPGEPEDKG
jgi:YfiH family protein